jgi:hypothetical protein
MAQIRRKGKKVPEYLNFDLEIECSQDGNCYEVSVLHSPEGETVEKMVFPFSAVELESRLKDIKIALLRSSSEHRLAFSPEEGAVRDFGKALFNAIMAGNVSTLYHGSQAKASAMHKGLRLRLRVKPVELSGVPWEFIYDPRQDEFVCLSTNTPLVRYINVPKAVPPVSVVRPLKILGMLVSPADQPPLNLAREKLRLEKALGPLQTMGLIELTWVEGKTWRELQRAIRNDTWHVFHFVGHGAYDKNTDEGLIFLEDEQGNTYRMGATQLSRALADSTSLRLVILNACEGACGGKEDIFSSTASILVRRGIPAVLAMQYEISDKAAIEFSCNFYEALAEGMPVDAATSEARKAMSFAAQRSLEWATPVLFMRLQDGRLFDIEDMALDFHKQLEIQNREQSEKERLEREQQILKDRQKIENERKAQLEKEIVDQRMKMARERQAAQVARKVEPIPKPEAPEHKSLIPAWWVIGPFILLIVGFLIFGQGIVQSLLFPAPTPPISPVTATIGGETHAPAPAIPEEKNTLTLNLSDPEEFARYYFSQINARNYDLTWSLLSAAYQAKSNPEGFSQYKNFWDKYTVTVLSVESLTLTNNITRVNLAVYLYDGNKNTKHTLNYYLTRNNSRETWMFDVKPKFGSAADTTCSFVPRLLTIGGQAKVVTDKMSLLLRDSPSESAVTLERLKPDTIVTVVDGPSCLPYRDAYFWWWRVRSPTNQQGWIVEGSDADDAIFIEPVR